MAKTGETLLILGVVVIGGYVAIRMLQGRTNFSFIPGILGPQFTRNQYIASPTTPGAIQPAIGGTPASRAQSTGGGVGGVGKVQPGAPPSNTILRYGPTPTQQSCAAKCAPLKNSPGTYTACCNANHVRRLKTMKGYMRWSYNATRDRITVV